MGIHQSLSLSRSPRISAFSLWIKVVSISRRAFHSLASMSLDSFLLSFFPLLLLLLSRPPFFPLLFSFFPFSFFFSVNFSRRVFLRGLRKRKLSRDICRPANWSVKFNGESLKYPALRCLFWTRENIMDVIYIYIYRIYSTGEKEFRSKREGGGLRMLGGTIVVLNRSVECQPRCCILRFNFRNATRLQCPCIIFNSCPVVRTFEL